MADALYRYLFFGVLSFFPWGRLSDSVEVNSLYHSGTILSRVREMGLGLLHSPRRAHPPMRPAYWRTVPHRGMRHSSVKSSDNAAALKHRITALQEDSMGGIMCNGNDHGKASALPPKAEE